jgi:hypothetical protein
MHKRTLLLLAGIVLLAATTVFAQFSPRKDFVWARAIPGGTLITTDGILSEPIWAKADSIVLTYGQRAGDPASGFLYIGSKPPTDPPIAVLKFLSDPVAKKLYFAAIVKDSSIGGAGWENSDGFFASIAGKGSQQGLKEITCWWLGVDSLGKVPTLGGWVPSPSVLDGKVHVYGVPNSDTTVSGQFVADTGYVVEGVLALDSLGVDPSAVSGDVLPMRVCIWDGDFNWPANGRNGYSREWWQGEWTDRLWGKVYFSPAVTTTSGAAPAPPVDLVIKNGVDYPTPVVDGDLSEQVWQYVPYFDLRYGDDALRRTFPPVGQATSAWFSPFGVVTDTARCRVKVFFKQDKLYFGFDVDDKKMVADAAVPDKADGISVTFVVPVDSMRDAQGRMASKYLAVRLDSTATVPPKWIAKAGDLDSAFVASGAVAYDIKLKNKTGGQPSTINNPGDNDGGYTIEMAFDLAKLGYTPGALQKLVSFGLTFYNANTYTTPADNFGSRIWWFREWADRGPGALALLDETNKVTAIEDEGIAFVPGEFRLYNNYPNPFNPSTNIRFSIPAAGAYTVRVYNILGQVVSTHLMTNATPGVQAYTFNAENLASGVYYYRVEFVPREAGAKRVSETGRMMLVK